MQFKKVNVGQTEGGQPVHADDLSLEHKARYFCQSCGNPLRLYWTHSAGRYFEHHLEQSEEKSLANCQYLLSSTPSRPANPLTPFEQAVYGVQHQDNPFLGFPQQQRFHCAMCSYDYDGFKTCPQCQDPMYTTEVKYLDVETIPQKFAR